MSSRNMRLLPRATLHSDSEHLVLKIIASLIFRRSLNFSKYIASINFMLSVNFVLTLLYMAFTVPFKARQGAN
jgi:hypothetical protein